VTRIMVTLVTRREAEVDLQRSGLGALQAGATRDAVESLMLKVWASCVPGVSHSPLWIDRGDSDSMILSSAVVEVWEKGGA
jgi:hypothetical protein